MFKKMNKLMVLSALLVSSMAILVACGSDEPIRVIWYPSESAADFTQSREDVARFVYEATGREVETVTTTDYVMALEALATGTADIGLDEMTFDGYFFESVTFAGSHQGSVFTLVSGGADVGVFNDMNTTAFLELVYGEEFQVGAVYQVRDNASEPLNNNAGDRVIIIAPIPVLNRPFLYNPMNLTADEIEAIRERLGQEDVSNTSSIFHGPDEIGLFQRTDGERFVPADRSFYDPLRRD